MKDFKKVFAAIFLAAAIVFGVIVMVHERSIFEQLGKLTFNSKEEGWVAAYIILTLIIDVLLIAAPVLGLVLVLLDKTSPYKAMFVTSLAVLAKFLLSIFLTIFVIGVWFADADPETKKEVWKNFFFHKDSMAIIPLVVFVAAVVVLLISTVGSLEGTVTRAILATIGGGLAIFGLVFYYVCSGHELFAAQTLDKTDPWAIFGIVVGIALFGALVAYSYLPQTREFKTEE